jgi:probable HAF family extracellular repeat protein
VSLIKPIEATICVPIRVALLAIRRRKSPIATYRDYSSGQCPPAGNLSKTTRHLVRYVSLLVASGAIAVSSASIAQAQYAITDLGTLPGGKESIAAGINASGQVVGTAYDPAGNSSPFLYSGGSMVSLGSLGGTDQGGAYGINSSGQVVGLSSLNDTDGGDAVRAFLYSGGTMHNLGLLPAGTSSVAYAINDSGQVTGDSYPPSGYPQGFLYNGVKLTNIGTLGGTITNANAINASGEVVGDSSNTGDQEYHAFLYNGTMHDLNPVGITSSEAYGINASGQIVGVLGNTQDLYHAFFYNGVTTKDIGTLGGLESFAYGINDSAEVVGSSEFPGSTSNTDTHAFVYSDGSLQDLNNLISPSSDWTLISATAINDTGQIVGDGISPSGQTHAFLLTPVVPEPGSASLLLIPGAKILLRRRRKVIGITS